MKVHLEVAVIEEAGYRSAIAGLSFSHKTQLLRAEKVALKLCHKDGGHNKFLESMYLWIEIRAPRYWWQEADTYRLSTKQSESTMHTLVKELREIGEGEDLSKYIRENFEEGSISSTQINYLWRAAREDNLLLVKRLLPEGFLQCRVWCMNYKCLRNIILQRKDHRLPHWQEFHKQIYSQVEHPELLP